MSLKKKPTVLTFEQLCRLNTAPVLRADTNWVKEDGPLKAFGNVLKSIGHPGAPGAPAAIGGASAFADVRDTDADGNVLKVTTTGTFLGKYGILKLNANGTYTYTLYTKAQKPGAFAIVQGLSEGEKLKEVFNYKATDGFVTKGSTLSITIFGTDDPVKITDLTPEAQGGDAVVDEDGLPGALLDAARPGETDSTESATAIGTFKISAPDGLDDLIVGGKAVITNGVFAAVTITTPLGNELKILSFNAATGVVTYRYTLLAAENHPGAGEDSIFENFVVKLTDVDGSSATASLDIRIVDDQPMIRVCQHNTDQEVFAATEVVVDCVPPTPLVVDDSDFGTDAHSSFAGIFEHDFGADGPGSIVYALGTPGGPSNLVDTLSGDPVSVAKEGNDIVGRIGPNPGDIVFVISIDPTTGDVTLDQRRAVVHSDPTTESESVVLGAGFVQVVATITDKDGDTDAATFYADGLFVFFDAAPTIDAVDVALPKLATDDSDIIDTAQANFAVLFTSAFGNDGPKDADDNDIEDADAITYTLQIDLAPTPLKDVLTGETITLILAPDGSIEGKTDISGLVVFKIEVDTTGLVTVTQNRAFVHPDNTDPNEPVFLPGNSISLKATITDGDLDTDYAVRDISGAFCFNDDGPAAIGGYSAGQVDEDLLPGGIEGGVGDIDNGLGTTTTVATGSVASLFDPGNDQPPSYVINLSAANLAALEALGLRSGTVSLAFSLSGDTLTATKGPGGTDVFTFKLDASTGTWTFTLKAPLDHPVADTEDDISIDFGGLIRIVDADGDWADSTGKVIVTIDDDTPVAANDGIIAEVYECIDNADIGSVASLLLGNDSYGADGAGSPQITINGGGSAGGTITIVAGQLHYTNNTPLNDGVVINDTFSYTIKDADGDTSTATFTVQVTGSDIHITRDPTNVSQDEDDLPAGIGDNASGDLLVPVGTGAIAYTLSANASSVTSFVLSAPTVTFTKLDGTGIVATWDALTQTLVGHATGNPLDIVFKIAVTSVTATGATYDFDLLQPVKHQGTNPGVEDDVTFTVTIDITDDCNETATANFTALIDDDTPIALNDGIIAAVFECIDDADIGSVASLLLANDKFGADGTGTPQVVINGGGSAGGTITIVAGQLHYTNNTPLNDGEVINDTFSYTIIDSEGDASTATFTVQVTGSDIHITERATNVSQDEDDLPNGIGDNANGDLVTPVAGGHINYTLSANASAVSSFVLSAPSVTFTKLDGTAIVAEWNALTNTLVGHAVGNPLDVVFTIVVNSVGTTAAAYTFDLLQPVKHFGSTPGFEDDVTVNVTIDITDDCNETATANFTALIDDDIPVANTVVNTNLTDDEGKGDFSAQSNPGVTPPTLGADVAGTPNQASGGAGSLFKPGADGLQSIAITGPAGIKAIHNPGTGLPAQESLTYTSATDISGNVKLTATGNDSGDVAFTLTINTDGSYLFTQNVALVHPLFNPSNEDDLPLAFNFTVTDKDGDTASATLTVTVDDDTPTGGTVIEDATETSLTNLMLIVDVSGSMNASSGIGTLTRLQAAQEAMRDLINAYDQNGDVVVRIVTFSDGAAEQGTQWMNVATAIATINGLTTGGFTNYDAALTAAQGAFTDAGAIAGGQGVSYFLSDGEPNRPVGDEGIDAGEEASWEAFLDTNNIISFSLGMGPGVTQAPLDPIAFNGVTGIDTNAIVVSDFAQLSSVLLSNTVSVLATGTVPGSFGADGGSFSLTTGGAPSGFTYESGGANTLLVKQAGTLVMTVTLDPLTGAYSIQQNAPVDHPAPGMDILPFVFTVALTDGDLDGATSTITLNLKDSVPTAANVNAGTLDDDSRAGGIAGGPGDFNPTLSTLSGLLGTSYGSDGAGSISFAALNGTTQNVNGITVTFSWNALTSTLTAHDGEENVFEVIVNQVTGEYTVNLLASLDHHTNANADNVETDATFNLGYVITDGDNDTANGTLSFTIDDDTPIMLNPQSIALINNGSDVRTALLDLDGDIDNNAGADGFGSLTFVNISQGQNSGMTSGGAAILLFTTAGGTVLEGRLGSAAGTKIFTVTLNHDAGGNDTYTVDMDGTIDNGAGVTFNDLTGTGPAGNPTFKLVESTSSDALELLFTPINETSVNSDADDIAAGSQFIDIGDPDKGLRIDFGDFTYVPNGPSPNDDGFTMVSHSTVNGFRFSIDQISGGTTADVFLKAYDANEGLANQSPFGGAPNGAHNFGDDTLLAITEVRIYDNLGVLVGTALGNASFGTIGVAFQPGGVLITNLLDDYSVVTKTGLGYDRIEVTNAGTPGTTDGKFSISKLQVETTNTGTAIDMNFDIALKDGDGDTALPTSELNIVLLPNSTVTQIGTSGNNTINGTSGADFLAGLAGNDSISASSNNDLLIGGAGQDQLTGSSGIDVFYFGAASDSPTSALADIIVDFDGDPAGGQDRIDLSGMDANLLTSLTDDPFLFGGLSAATVANSITYEVLGGGDILIHGDVTGDTTADFFIRLTANASIASLQATDFAL